MRAYLFLLFLIFAGCEQVLEKPQTRPVRAMKVDEKASFASRQFPGTTRAVDRVNLSFRVSGPLIQRGVNVGDSVQKGALLAEIDPADFAVQFESAQGNLERAQAVLQFALADYKRVQSLYKKDPGAISASDLDKKLGDVQRTQGQIRALTAQVAQAQNQLDYTKLTAPFEGTVTATYVENFEFVQAKQPIVRLLNTSRVEMVVDIPESMIAYLGRVDEVVVTFDAVSEKPVVAEIKEIGTEASATTRTYPVTLVIDQPEEFQVYAGMSGWAEFKVFNVASFGADGFILPPSALFSEKESSFVYIVNPAIGTVYRRKVTIDQLTSRGVFITSGLKRGDWVVTAGISRLSEGQEVEIQPVELNAKGEQIELPKERSWNR